VGGTSPQKAKQLQRGNRGRLGGRNIPTETVLSLDAIWDRKPLRRYELSCACFRPSGPLLDPRFRRAGVYFIPEGALDWSDQPASYVPDLSPPADDETAWRSDDALFAPLEGSAGRHYGIISVDEPESGRRPDDQELEVLSAFAAHAGLAIESSRHVAELGAALVRHRAVIESSLDCVIAIDG